MEQIHTFVQSLSHQMLQRRYPPVLFDYKSLTLLKHFSRLCQGESVTPDVTILDMSHRCKLANRKINVMLLRARKHNAERRNVLPHVVRSLSYSKRC